METPTPQSIISQTEPPPRAIAKARLEMIDACGRMSQILGFPRTTGQIYGLLYFSCKPICLEEIAETLGISKASSSLGTRELCSWNAIRQVWVHGNRKGFFEVEPELAELLKGAYREWIKPRISSSKLRLERLTTALNADLKDGRINSDEHGVLSSRLKRFYQLQRKVQTVIHLGEKVL